MKNPLLLIFDETSPRTTLKIHKNLILIGNGISPNFLCHISTCTQCICNYTSENLSHVPHPKPISPWSKS